MTKNGKKENKEWTRGGKETVRQQFTEQMDQLCRPNYREKEVGASGGDVNKDRQRGRQENKSRWRSGGRDTNVTRGERCRGGRVADLRAGNQLRSTRQIVSMKEYLLSLRSHTKQTPAHPVDKTQAG